MPPDAPPRKTRARRRGGGRPRRRLLKRAAWAALAVGAVLVAAPALFVGLRCYSGASDPAASSPAESGPAAVPRYARDEASTYLTFPEWYIVYSTEEHAAFVERQPPSRFPYFRSILQYWSTYGSVCGATRGVYPFNGGTHLMLGVIGVSFTIENAVKGIYEKTVGRFTEWIGSRDTEEDRFAQRTEREYGAFMHHTPWYRFPFVAKLAALWRDTPFWGSHPVRKWERKSALTLEYAFKAAYGWIIGRGTATVYDPEELVTYARVLDRPGVTASSAEARRVRPLDDGSWLVAMPRYEAFTPAARSLVERGVAFVDVAGNDRMLATMVAPRQSVRDLPAGSRVLFRVPVLTRPGWERIAVDAAVPSLHGVLTGLSRDGIEVEHLYDY